MTADDVIEPQFPSVSSKNLIRLGEDLLQVFSNPPPDGWRLTVGGIQHMSLISEIMPRDRTAHLQSAEAAVLAGTFRRVRIPC